LNLVLGNDILIKLHADQEWVSLTHGQETELSVEASVTTNPFCRATCSYTFEDISTSETIDNDTFTIRPGVPFRQAYTIAAPALGTGTTIYRFSLACASTKTIWCHTREEPTTRNTLVLVSYDLTEDEKQLKYDLQQELSALLQQLEELQGAYASFETILPIISTPLLSNISLLELNYSLTTLHTELLQLVPFWQEQDYYHFTDSLEGIRQSFSRAEQQLFDLNQTITKAIQDYNAQVETVDQIRFQLQSLASQVLNESMHEEVNATIMFFNEWASADSINSTLLTELSGRSSALYRALQRETLHQELVSDLTAEILCRQAQVCIPHPVLEQRVQQQDFTLAAACDYQAELGNTIKTINTSLAPAFQDQSYPNTTSFWNEVSLFVKNARQQVINEYIQYLPDGNNTNLILEILEQGPFQNLTLSSQYNYTPAFISDLSRQIPLRCELLNQTGAYDAIKPFNHTAITLPSPALFISGISFAEPEAQCCAFGKCTSCRTAESTPDPSLYPVIFLHGHAVSKETSAEYSLEGFNQLQQQLEAVGYLNAGAITAYTSRDVPEGAWGSIPAPLTVRASYYFDIFEDPENYIIVPAKSENIDTYAIRIKDMIATLQYKTGQPKVNIIAFSMGGLVARRYIQLFGTEQVATLVLIGTPNHGVSGEVATLCDVVGESRECQDLTANSTFLKKLNRGTIPNIPIYNIIGTGCMMDQGRGDGAVLEESAYLAGAQNFIVNGTCLSAVKPLHLELRDINKYPEVYEIIKEALNG